MYQPAHKRLPDIDIKNNKHVCVVLILQEDTYTFMNPVGTLSNQIWSSPEKGSAMMYNGGDETFSLEHPLGGATQSDGNQTGIGSSMSSSAFPIVHHQDELEERYVKGAF